MRQRSLFGEAGEQRARDTGTMESYWREANHDQPLLGLIRLAEYGRLLGEGAITNTPSTRRRPQGEEGIRAGERTQEAALHEVGRRLLAAGCSAEGVDRCAEAIMRRLSEQVQWERAGGLHRKQRRRYRAPMLPGLAETLAQSGASGARADRGD